MSIAKGEKAGILGSVKRGYRGVMGELKKVHWPSKKEIAAYTLVVVVAVLIVAAGIWVVDAGISYVMNMLIGR
ncbi:MAG TPA: preprotein translocase subunit SecE [Peptococcaceae bacterium]|jgi:preprotein translocase subunit SecE|nr:preprotein translocase subunit SecE [Clostridia bacterium]HOB82190.1 preprotein translocase subunit SecE [Peptococcaceae bacterium]HPZ71812.1 preprotein translocase subunit SecE [Peptococcaceae bacterium]HQD53953.1 preprotein translocase subunit SecE [Peptococcaceae bacterium]